MNRKGRIICLDTFPICDEVSGEEKYGTSTWLKMKALVERRKLYCTNMSNTQDQPEPEPEPMENGSLFRVRMEKEDLCVQCQLPGYYLGSVHACQGIVSAVSVELPTVQNDCPGDSSMKHTDVISKTKTGKDKVVCIDLEDSDMAGDDEHNNVISKTKTRKDKGVCIDLEDDEHNNVISKTIIGKDTSAYIDLEDDDEVADICTEMAVESESLKESNAELVGVTVSNLKSSAKSESDKLRQYQKRNKTCTDIRHVSTTLSAPSEMLAGVSLPSENAKLQKRRKVSKEKTAPVFKTRTSPIGLNNLEQDVTQIARKGEPRIPLVDEPQIPDKEELKKVFATKVAELLKKMVYVAQELFDLTMEAKKQHLDFINIAQACIKKVKETTETNAYARSCLEISFQLLAKVHRGDKHLQTREQYVGKYLEASIQLLAKVHWGDEDLQSQEKSISTSASPETPPPPFLLFHRSYPFLFDIKGLEYFAQGPSIFWNLLVDDDCSL